MISWQRVSGVLVAGAIIAAHAGFAQEATTKPKPKTTVKPGMAVWSPDVEKILGVKAENFKAEGLDKLSPAQLTALLISAKPDPRKGLLTCPASGAMPSGRMKVLVTVAGDDPTGAIAAAIHHAVASLNEVDVVDSAAAADRALH